MLNPNALLPLEQNTQKESDNLVLLKKQENIGNLARLLKTITSRDDLPEDFLKDIAKVLNWQEDSKLICSWRSESLERNMSEQEMLKLLSLNTIIGSHKDYIIEYQLIEVGYLKFLNSCILLAHQHLSMRYKNKELDTPALLDQWQKLSHTNKNCTFLQSSYNTFLKMLSVPLKKNTTHALSVSDLKGSIFPENYFELLSQSLSYLSTSATDYFNENKIPLKISNDEASQRYSSASRHSQLKNLAHQELRLYQVIHSMLYNLPYTGSSYGPPFLNSKRKVMVVDNYIDEFILLSRVLTHEKNYYYGDDAQLKRVCEAIDCASVMLCAYQKKTFKDCYLKLIDSKEKNKEVLNIFSSAIYNSYENSTQRFTLSSYSVFAKIHYEIENEVPLNEAKEIFTLCAHIQSSMDEGLALVSNSVKELILKKTKERFSQEESILTKDTKYIINDYINENLPMRVNALLECWPESEEIYCFSKRLNKQNFAIMCVLLKKISQSIVSECLKLTPKKIKDSLEYHASKRLERDLIDLKEVYLAKAHQYKLLGLEELVPTKDTCLDIYNKASQSEIENVLNLLSVVDIYHLNNIAKSVGFSVYQIADANIHDMHLNQVTLDKIMLDIRLDVNKKISIKNEKIPPTFKL